MQNEVFTLNTHFFKYTLPGTFYWKLLYNDGRRCDELCDYIKTGNFKVVMLSEVWGWFMKRRIIRKLRNEYPYYWIPPRGNSGLKLGPEMLFLSKEKIIETDYANFTALGGWDKYSIKGIYGMVVGDTLYCNTHFDANTVENRQSNQQQVMEFLNKHANMGKVIVGGDFNTAEGWQPYTQMATVFGQQGFVDAYRTMYPSVDSHPGHTVDQELNDTAYHFSNGEVWKCRLDYYFVKGVSVSDVNVVIKNYGDHFPITIKYT